MTRGRLAMLSVALVAITIAVFARVVACDFVNYDDIGYVTQNDRILRGLTIENIAWAFTALDLANWHPLTWLSHMFDCTLFRQADGSQNAGMHHLVNLLWHTANAVILFLVLHAMTGAPWRSWFVAALFAIHPLHVQSVAWVAERKDVLSTCFGFLAIAAYLGWVRRRRWTWLAGATALFALSLMAKPMLVTLPLVLLLLDYWPLKRLSAAETPPRQARIVKKGLSRAAVPGPRPVETVWTLIGEKLPMIVLAIASSFLTIYAQGRGGAMENMQRYGLDVRLGNAIISYGKYMSQMIWPVRLSPLYPYPHAIDSVVLFSTVALLVVVSFTAVVTVIRWPQIFVGWLWYLVTLLPVIGILQVGEQARADRYTYVPLIGLFIIIAWMIPAPRADRAWAPQMLLRVVPIVVALAMLAQMSWRNVGYWRDSVTLYEHALAVTDDNPVIEHNLGVAFMERGEPEKAMQRIRTALRLRSNYVAATRNLGRVLLSMGRVDEGVTQLEMAVTAEPGFAVTVSDLGVGYKRQGRLDQAELQFEKSVTLDPNVFNSQLNLGSLFFEQRRFGEALPHLQNALEMRPDDATALHYVGACLAGLGRLQEARMHLEQAARIRPDWIDPHLNLGNVLLAQKEIDLAIAQYQMAVNSAGNANARIEARNTLARVLAQTGRFEQAIVECQKLIDEAPTNPAYHMNLAVLLVSASDQKYRDPARAVQLAQKACELTNRRDAALLSALAQTQAAAKMFEQAVQTSMEAAQAARSQGNEALAREIEQQAALYRSGRAE